MHEAGPAPAPSSTRNFLTPGRCRVVFAALLLFGLLSHLRYLYHDCPIDLSGDEAHYWDWSRQLDYCYYSKGPLVAWLIRASCAILGDNMPAVRMPALVLAVGTSILTYWLARKLFDSDRIALGAVVLNHLVPMFVAGSVMMTIDAPFFFFWGLATCFAVKAIADDARWAWVAMGLAIGVGFLAKFTMFLWLLGLFIFLFIDRPSRKHLRSPALWIGICLACLFTLPPLLWNRAHGWVSAKHIRSDTAGRDAIVWDFSFFGRALRTIGEFIGGQVGAVGPMLAIILVAALVYALGRRGQADPRRRAMLFLAMMGLPLYALVLIVSTYKGVGVNWPAPAYFTFMILGAYFLATRMASPEKWKRWRGLVWGTAIFGIAFAPIAHDTSILYPSIAKLGGKKPIEPRKWDPTFRLRGWEELGKYIGDELVKLRPGALVMAEEYQWTSEAAFYTKGQPKTYYLGSWFADPERRWRLTQFDVWPDRALDQPQLVGRDAIVVAHEPFPAQLEQAFASVERLPDLDIQSRGVKVRTFRLWRCTGFKGLPRPDGRDKF